MTNSENCHLTITSIKFINVKKTLTKKTIFSNDITIYEDENTVEKIEKITETTLQI